jgi:hypothetical protein
MSHFTLSHLSIFLRSFYLPIWFIHSCLIVFSILFRLLFPFPIVHQFQQPFAAFSRLIQTPQRFNRPFIGPAAAVFSFPFDQLPPPASTANSSFIWPVWMGWFDWVWLVGWKRAKEMGGGKSAAGDGGWMEWTLGGSGGEKEKENNWRGLADWPNISAEHFIYFWLGHANLYGAG